MENLYHGNYPYIRLGDLIRQVSVRNRDESNENVMSVSNKYGFIAQSEQFEERSVASDDTSNYKVVSKGTFAYNPARINVGSIAQYKNNDDCIVSPMYICFNCENRILNDYLEHFFSTKYFFKEMNKRLEGSVRQCLSFDALCNIPISLPSEETQRKNSLVIDSIVDKIALETNILQSYRCQKTYLLQQMFI